MNNLLLLTEIEPRTLRPVAYSLHLPRYPNNYVTVCKKLNLYLNKKFNKHVIISRILIITHSIGTLH